MTFAEIVEAMRAEGWFLWNLARRSKHWQARWATYLGDERPGTVDGKGMSKQGIGTTAEAAMLAAAEDILPKTALADEMAELGL